MRQAKVLEDRKLTVTDTGVAWFKFAKTELVYDEWYEFLTDVCEVRSLNQENVEFAMTNCGLPGISPFTSWAFCESNTIKRLKILARPTTTVVFIFQLTRAEFIEKMEQQEECKPQMALVTKKIIYHSS
ncbi:unnamed protein product [Arctia plantaginis]|uniref:Uncharacterized protein n=1 Tax=Arctia plantaginis TaxID=874455 RepID=A0A8S1BPJ6_ARCPL|nr:unnamed protein product [Arctia plantaginis]